MPSEVRYIFFSPSEILAAVRELRHRRGHPVANGAVKVATLIAGADIGYRLVVAPNHGGPEREYVFDATELGAALVFFCISRGIPLPASASKSMRISGDDVVLGVNMSASRVQLQRLFRTPQFGSRQRVATVDPPGSLPVDSKIAPGSRP